MDSADNRHFAVIDPYRRKLTIKFGDQVIAATTNALILKEHGRSLYDPVFYIPKEDISVELEREADTTGFCPIKGHAHRWHMKDQPLEQYIAWSYEDPLPRGRKIMGHLAFNMRYVSFVSEPVPA